MIILNISGNITARPITKTFGKNTLTAFTIASNNRYKTKSGELIEETTYVRCAIWNKPEVGKLLHQGRSISATGIFKPTYWTDGEGQQQINLNLKVSFFQLFGKNEFRETVTETYTADTPPLTEEETATIEKEIIF